MTLDKYKADVGDRVLDGRWIFRGQSNQSWSLETSYSRFIKNLNQDFSLESFWKMLDAFIKRSSEHSGSDRFTHINLLQQMSFAQHYGVPTPILDWSYSPYIALYFAMDKSWCYQNQHDSPKSVRIWAINLDSVSEEYHVDDSDELNQKKLGEKWFLNLNTSLFCSKRIYLQQGCFTFQNFSGCLNEKKNTDNLSGIDIIYYDIDISLKQTINELKMMGLTSVNLFDDIDYISYDLMFDKILNGNNNA